MNCKPGDLAIVVFSHCGNEGRIVRCLRLATEAELIESCFANFARVNGPMWVVDGKLRTTWGTVEPFATDAYLRPITPPPGSVSTDEVRELYAPKEPVYITTKEHT